MRNKNLLFVSLILIVIGIVGLGFLRFNNISNGANTSFAERGAWIFNTGTDPNGQPIAYSGGMMMRGSCASCHGANGHGLRTPMFTSPHITYRNLTDSTGMIESDGSRGMVYADDLIRRAVIQGIDAEGKSPDSIMPCWRLTDTESSDLLAFLKTLP